MDGEIGKIDEATYDVGSPYIVVDTGPWIFGRKVLLPAGVIQRIDPNNEKVYVDRTKEQIKDSPEFDESTYRDEPYRTGSAATTAPRVAATPRTSKPERNRARGGGGGGCADFADLTELIFSGWEFTDSHHVPADTAKLVANAIAMHHTPGVGLESGAEAYLLSAGASVDVFGLRSNAIPDAVRQNVIQEYPRLGFKREFAGLLRAEAEQVPRGRAWYLHRFALSDLSIRLAPFRS